MSLGFLSLSQAVCGARAPLFSPARDAIQGDLDRVEKWAYADLIQFSKAKSKVLHMELDNSKNKCILGRA